MADTDPRRWPDDPADTGTPDPPAPLGHTEGFIVPPVSQMGPSAGVPNIGVGSSTGTGVAPFPVPAVPVVEDDGEVDTGRLANPFAPADPDNDAPFVAGRLSAADLPSRVEAELASDGRFREAALVVTSDDGGTVTLSGTAPAAELAADAVAIASHVPGVRAVVNAVRITTE